MSYAIRLLGMTALLAVSAWAQDGSLFFHAHCATCHRLGSSTRAPWVEVLRQLSRSEILESLEKGKMQAQGTLLTAEQRAAVAEYLGKPDGPEERISGFCDPSDRPFKIVAGWNGWGVDQGNSRFQPAEAAGLTRLDVPRLKLKWAFGLPRVSSMLGQPTVIGERVFFGSQGGTVYSVNARTGCVNWTFKAGWTVRTAIVISPDGQRAYFGDLHGTVYAVHAQTGALVWKTQVDEHPQAVITAAPKLHAGRLFVPVSSFEELAASASAYECCTFRGSVVALNAKNGRVVWKTFTVPQPAQPMGKSQTGKTLWGPSGVAVWSSPTLDPARNVMYIATGGNYADPATPHSDAVMGLDMKTGKVLWVQQLTPNDRWNISCTSSDPANCSPAPGPDFDLGASPILIPLARGKRLLVAGQKSGVVHALDPDQQGKIVWQTRIGKGGIVGGIEWGGATDGQAVYFPLSDYDPERPEAGGGLFALDPRGGRVIWHAPAPKPECLGKPGCSAAQPAPASAIPGVVFSGSLDGHLRAYDTSNGDVIWEFDTQREFETVNGIRARGGSLNATGPTVAGGMLFVASGYLAVAGMPGNVLLAFSVDGK